MSAVVTMARYPTKAINTPKEFNARQEIILEYKEPAERARPALRFFVPLLLLLRSAFPMLVRLLIRFMLI
jgi:hypothetical protein